MREAIRLARKARVAPYPNPWVGCVIVKNEKVVGRGFHRGPGTSHAETEALAEAGARARGATLYVNLEPCCHYGRTPPCTDAILRAGIRRVVYALRDPNPLVAGRGARILLKRGVEVISGLCSEEAVRLNEAYLKFRSLELPFVSVKVATSLDGKIATRTGESKWITGPAARRRGRELRARHQAVLVGIRTVLADDPHLGPRRSGAMEPWRVILDSKLRIPTRSRVVRTGRCIVAATATASPHKKAQLERSGAQVWLFKGKRVPLRPLLHALAKQGVLSVLVEGGGETLGSFFDSGLVDRVYWFISPVVIGSSRSRSAVAGRGARELARAPRLRDTRIEAVGECWMVCGNLSRWALA
ncbi:MAG: bifunctional diaminohydroxyphosphoribosylaminopyrimidine deaminase/5-amino-6-(5-phosphoribosylamino)uracil reductase RibD [Terriglobia bacterium]